MYRVTFRCGKYAWAGAYGSLKALSVDARMFIELHNMGASDWDFPDIYQDGVNNGKPLYSISYTSRIFTMTGAPVDIPQGLTVPFFPA